MYINLTYDDIIVPGAIDVPRKLVISDIVFYSNFNRITTYTRTNINTKIVFKISLI